MTAYDAIAIKRRQQQTDAVLRQMTAIFGDLLDDPGNNNVMIFPPLPGQGDYRVVTKRGAGRLTVRGATSQGQVERFFSLVSGFAGRELSEEKPTLDVTIPHSGERIHIDLPPLVPGPMCSIRIPYKGSITLAEFVAGGVMTEAQRTVLAQVVAGREHSLLITGAVDTGKTTLLRALMDEPGVQDGLPAFVQDPPEFVPTPLFAVSYSADRFGSEWQEMRRLIQNGLRWPITHVFIGEGRGMEMLQGVEAAATGNPVYATAHANSAADGLDRVAQMVGMNGISIDDLQMRWIAKAFRFVCHIEVRDGVRRIAGIVECTGYQDGRFVLRPAM
jgi:Flp pilus assembly CpaF family ATPase